MILVLQDSCTGFLLLICGIQSMGHYEAAVGLQSWNCRKTQVQIPGQPQNSLGNLKPVTLPLSSLLVSLHGDKRGFKESNHIWVIENTGGRRE